MATALLIVDMVKGFVDKETSDGKCALYLPEARSLIQRINKHIKELPHGSQIFHITDSHSPDDDEFKSYKPHCITGTLEAEPADGFEYKPFWGPFVIRKTRFSGFYKTDLERSLRDFHIDHVIIVGVCTEICVLATVIDAVMRGFKVTVYDDSVIALNPSNGDAALVIMEDVYGVKMLG